MASSTRPSTPTGAIRPDSLAPTHANWGWDNRAYVRAASRRSAAAPRASRSGSPTAPRTRIWRSPQSGRGCGRRAGGHDPAAARRRRRIPRGPELIGPPCPPRLDAAFEALEGDASCAGRSARRSSRRSWRSSASRSSATAPGSRIGRSPSTCITSDPEPQHVADHRVHRPRRGTRTPPRSPRCGRLSSSCAIRSDAGRLDSLGRWRHSAAS